MKKIYSVLFIFLNLIFVNSILAEDKEHLIRVKTGNYHLLEPSQTISTSSNTTRTFTKESNTVFGIEYEVREKKNISMGFEIFHFENNFQSSNSNLLYKSEANIITFNVKYYFKHNSSFQPYIGIGKGKTLILPAQDTNTTYTPGAASQLLLGFSYHFTNASIYTEYKYLRAFASNQLFLTTDNDEMTLTGHGLFISVGIPF